MEWRSACRMSAINDAHRLTRVPGQPYRAILYGNGRATVVDCDGHKLVESEADKFHDWEPVSRVDPITALGNVAKKAPIKPLKALGRTPFDSFLGGQGW
jgi:hypothetical protein